jgi:hypothetical protein
LAQSLFVRPDVQAFLDYLRQAAAAGAPAMHQMAPTRPARPTRPCSNWPTCRRAISP